MYIIRNMLFSCVYLCILCGESVSYINRRKHLRNRDRTRLVEFLKNDYIRQKGWSVSVSYVIPEKWICIKQIHTQFLFNDLFWLVYDPSSKSFSFSFKTIILDQEIITRWPRNFFNFKSCKSLVRCDFMPLKSAFGIQGIAKTRIMYRMQLSSNQPREYKKICEV